MKSQTDDLNIKKSEADAKIESLEKELRTLSTKVAKEVEKKYKQEIEEKEFFIQNLKRETETLHHVQKSEKSLTKFDSGAFRVWFIQI